MNVNVELISHTMPQESQETQRTAGRKMTAVNGSEVVIGFDDGAGLEVPLDCPEYSMEAEEILMGRNCSFCNLNTHM